MNIVAIAALPLFLQAAASGACPVNQYVAPNADVCYAIIPSLQNPTGVDATMLDLINFQYLQTRWLDPNTMVSRLETATTTYCWYDDGTAETFPCQ